MSAACLERREIVELFPKKGGVLTEKEIVAIIGKNGFALTDDETVSWLFGLEDGLSGNQVADRALIELDETSDDRVWALKRLYRIRSTARFREFVRALQEEWRNRRIEN